MSTKEGLIASALSGVIWGGVGVTLAYVSMLPSQPPSPFEIVRSYLGGILISPLIGLLAFLPARRFAQLAPVTKAIIAGVVLYLAVALFLLAAGLYHSAVRGIEGRGLVTGSLAGAFAGLTLTGAFVLLWPLAYFNLALVARLSRPGPNVRDSEA